MVTHFGDIGFAIKNTDDYGKLLEFATRNGQFWRTKRGDYCLYSPNEGIQLWILSQNELLVDVIPYYEGKSRLRVKIQRLRLDHNITGQVECWVNPKDENDVGDCPFLFDVPNYWLVNNQIKEGRVYFIRLTAFAEHVTFYKSKKEFSSAPKNKFPKNSKGVKGFAPNYFIPTGQFSDEKDSNTRPTAMFAGEVKEWRLITNKKTNLNFYWLLVETLFGELDVVCSENALKNKPHIGGILDGHFYLIAKFDVKEQGKMLLKISPAVAWMLGAMILIGIMYTIRYGLAGLGLIIGGMVLGVGVLAIIATFLYLFKKEKFRKKDLK